MLFVQQWLTGKHIKRERVKRQAMIHKTLHRKINIKQYEPY